MTTTRPGRTARRRALAGTSAIVLLGSLAVGAPASAHAATAVPRASGPSAASCPTGPLPALVAGRPAGFRAGLPAGYWIWHDARGWHLRVTRPGRGRTVFSGVVTATGPMTTARVDDEAQDRIARSRDRRTTVFSFVDHGGVDGLDFTAGCAATVSFRLYVDGRLAPPTRIHLGSTAAAATADPLRITRVRAV